MIKRVPTDSSRARVRHVTLATDAIDASASPRKPSVVMWREIIGGGELAGGVAAEGEFHFAGRNARSVVADADERSSAVARLDGEIGRAGVDGVLDQFFHDRGGPLDDFTGGDLRHEVGGQNANGHGGILPFRTKRPRQASLMHRLGR